MEIEKNVGLKIKKMVVNGDDVNWASRKHIICFASPHDKFVIRCEDRLLFYDSLTFKQLREIRNRKNKISYVATKRNNSSFITTSDTISCFSIIHPFKEIKKFVINKVDEIYDIVMINEGKFLAYNEEFIQLVSYENGCVLKEFGKHVSHTWLKWILISKFFENCFFVHQDFEDVCVKLFNYETTKLEKEFKIFEKSACVDTTKDIMCMDTMLNRKKQEVLICGGKSSYIILYNLTEDAMIDEIKCVKDNWKFCVKFLNDRYFIIGDDLARIELYDMSSNKLNLVSEEFLETSSNCWIMSFSVLRKGNKAIIHVGTDRGDIQILETHGIVLGDGKKNMQMLEDEKERYEFLSLNTDDFIFRENEKKLILVNLSLKNISFNEILRVLFC